MSLPTNPEGFDPGAYLAGLVPERPDWYAVPALRRAVCRHNPLAFALVYLPHHLRSEETGNQITLSAFHLAMVRYALSWTRPRAEAPKADRSAWVAPRGSGKSTWGFLILPLWALAFGWRSFVAAYADAGPQAERHLMSLKMELDTSALLRADFPELVEPAKRPIGTTVSDRQDSYIARSGAAFIAKGIDSSTLGAKIGNRRPDLILFDDVEPDESNYSAYQKGKRLTSIRDAVLPMNLYATVMFLGTTVMVGSIVHDLVRQLTEVGDDVPTWPGEEQVIVRHFPALMIADDGEERSLWPALWPTDFLISIRHTRGYAKNFANDPMGADGGYWTVDDFVFRPADLTTTRWLMEIDPAVTTKTSSDWTGIVIGGYSPVTKRVTIALAIQVRLTGERLAAYVLRLLATELGSRVKAVRVEVNQGGDLWKEVFRRLPVRLLVHTSSDSKEVRFARALDYYQRGRVTHAEHFATLQQQQTAFPRGAYDDVADAAVGLVLYFLTPPSTVTVSVKRTSYVGGSGNARHR